MNYDFETFVEKYNKKEITFVVDKNFAMNAMVKKNKLIELMPKGVKFAYHFWMAIFQIMFWGGLLGLILSFFIFIGGYFWYFVLFVLS